MEELNLIAITVTALVSFIGAFIGAYLSFHFKKKEKKFQNKLEIEAKIIEELKIPIYEMEKNISYFKLYFKSEGIDQVTKKLFNGEKYLTEIAEQINDNSTKVNYILEVNRYYIKNEERELIIEETLKAKKAGFYCSFFSSKYFDKIYTEKIVKEALESSMKELNNYDSKKVHSILPKLIN